MKIIMKIIIDYLINFILFHNKLIIKNSNIKVTGLLFYNLLIRKT